MYNFVYSSQKLYAIETFNLKVKVIKFYLHILAGSRNLLLGDAGEPYHQAILIRLRIEINHGSSLLLTQIFLRAFLFALRSASHLGNTEMTTSGHFLKTFSARLQ